MRPGISNDLLEFRRAHDAKRAEEERKRNLPSARALRALRILLLSTVFLPFTVVVYLFGLLIDFGHWLATGET